MANYQGLAMRIKAQGKTGNQATEFAVVASVNPLTIEIGGQKYSAKDWEMYEPLHKYKEIKLKDGKEVDMQGMSHPLKSADYKELEAKTVYEVGDMLAVQQINDTLFIILCKLRRVE